MIEGFPICIGGSAVTIGGTDAESRGSALASVASGDGFFASGVMD
jgi:hypothetical protein